MKIASNPNSNGISHNAERLNKLALGVENGMTSSFDQIPLGTITKSDNPTMYMNSDETRTTGGQAPQFHYEVPNLTSVLYEYTNKEQDLVKQGFRPGNYTSLRSLPDEIAPFTVTHAQKVKVQDTFLNSQITSQNAKIYNQILKDNGGVFQKFQYVDGDKYDAEKLIQKRYNEIQKEKQISGPFNPAQVKRTFVYEYPFLGKDEKHTYSFLSQEDPYSISSDDRLKAKWVDEVKQLYGPFIPAGATHPIERVSKSLMKEIVDCVKKLLLSDWNDVNFVLGTNPNDFIEVKFDTTTVDNPVGLHSYMNTMLNTNDDVIRYQLRKISYYWGFKEGNFIYYMLAPPWLKVYVNDAINQTITKQQSNLAKSVHNDSVTAEGNPKRPVLFSKEIQIE